MNNPSTTAHKTLEILSNSPEETFRLGQKLGCSLPEGSVLIFYGDLAAGKTTFIKGVATAASKCHVDEVNSPTFVYLNIYNGSKTVYHFDLYRLSDEDEFLGMGFDEYFFSEGISCVEWAERIPGLIPSNAISVRIEHQGNDKRHIVISPWEDS